MSTSKLKISIAALSLCVSAVAIYIHLPYVIAAVSGSGTIEAVPLAIFAVSAIVALVSVICLIRLAVSRAGDKKKIDLSGEESGHTASQEPQEKPVKQDSESQIKVDSGTSSQHKSSVPTSPSQPPQTRDTASSQVPQEKSVKQDSGSQIKVDSDTSSQHKSSVPTAPSQPPQTHVTAVPQVPQEKPVKQDSGSQIKVDSGTSLQDKSSVPTSPSQSPQTCDTASSQVPHSVLLSPSSPPSGAVPPPPPPPPVTQIDPLAVYKERIKNKTGATASTSSTSHSTNSSSLAEEAKIKRAKLKRVSIVKQDSDTVQSNKGTDKKETQEEKYNKRVDKLQEERRKRNENDSDLKKALEERLAVMAPSDNESEQSSWTSNEDGHAQTEPEQAEKEQIKYTNPPSSKEEGSVGLDSGIGSRATSPLYFEQKTEEPPSSHVNSSSIAQVKSVNPVDNKVQDSSIPPIEDHAKFSASKGGVPRSS